MRVRSIDDLRSGDLVRVIGETLEIVIGRVDREQALALFPVFQHNKTQPLYVVVTLEHYRGDLDPSYITDDDCENGLVELLQRAE